MITYPDIEIHYNSVGFTLSTSVRKKAFNTWYRRRFHCEYVITDGGGKPSHSHIFTAMEDFNRLVYVYLTNGVINAKNKSMFQMDENQQSEKIRMYDS